jgi:Methyltransferase domain
MACSGAQVCGPSAGVDGVKLAVNRMPVRLVRSLLNRVLHRSDYKMWSDPANLSPEWDQRTQRLAKFVPVGARVIEFGAGRRELERHLASGCTYFPSDLVDRGNGTVVLDLNHPDKPDLRHLNAEVAVFGGTLEYVSDLPALVHWLSEQISDRCICSYATARSRRGTLARAWEAFLRARDSWVNAFTEEELIQLFSSSGFRCAIRDTWKGQTLFVFDRGSTSKAISQVGQ